MRSLLTILVVSLAALGPTLLARPASGQPGGSDHVSAELLADTTAVAPGRPFTVGVLLKLDPGWHVYWKYPGDTGLPTTIAWTLPPGFAAGELQFPTPERFTQPGDIVGYGYSGEVMLTAVVTPPADLPAGTDVGIKAEVGWLVCEAVCIPGRATLETSLPVRTEGAPALAEPLRERFARHREALPVAVDQAEAVGTHAAVGKMGSSGGGSAVTLFVGWADPAIDPAAVEWFPDVPAPLLPGRASVRQENGITVIELPYEVIDPTAARSVQHMNSVLAYRDKDGRRRGVELPVTLDGTTNMTPYWTGVFKRMEAMDGATPAPPKTRP